MKEELLQFIKDKKFPCIMAKAVASHGYISVIKLSSPHVENNAKEILHSFYEFIDDYRKNPDKLNSFIVTHNFEIDFDAYENYFWKLLKAMSTMDKKNYPHDERVSSDPYSERYSYSVKSEAFFILALHPDSPRLARRFKSPTIVFNPHQQFEDLRTKGIYAKVRDIIRARDKLLQGFVNPMLKDFGEKSEIFQYMGKSYASETSIPF